MNTEPTIQHLGLRDYESVWQAMKAFTAQRDQTTVDEIWLVEHPAVFTQGRNGKPEHILNPGKIPIVQTDRGGQITYHGPGQLVAYLLFDLSRRKLGAKQFVLAIEQAIIKLLEQFNLTGTTRCDAPGVYVDGAKICSIGLRIKHGCTYHGLAFNIDMDLRPFSQINPCGYTNMPITQLSQLAGPCHISDIATRLVTCLNAALSQ